MPWLRQKARTIRDAGYAVVALSGVNPWEQIFTSCGMERTLFNLVADPDFILALMRKITDLMKAGVIKLLDEAGDYIDVLITGDDLGMQNGPMMAPRMYRRMIKPFHAELLSEIKRRTQAKIFFHSDGNVYPLLGDFIEIGVDLLNPVQVSANEMGDTARLKREFGKRLAFYVIAMLDAGRAALKTNHPGVGMRHCREAGRSLGPAPMAGRCWPAPRPHRWPTKSRPTPTWTVGAACGSVAPAPSTTRSSIHPSALPASTTSTAIPGPTWPIPADSSGCVIRPEQSRMPDTRSWR